jgi:hypothetical protein
MKSKKAAVVLAAVMFLFTGKLSAQEVKYDFDHSADFSQYKTFSWETVQTKDPLMVARIKDSVNRTLAAKGLTLVPSGGDVAVFAVGTTEDQQTWDTFYDGIGGGRRWGGLEDATTTVETYKVGTLVIGLFDAKTKKLVWRGSSSDTVSNDANKNTKNLDKGVTKMFKNFPPNVPSKNAKGAK